MGDSKGVGGFWLDIGKLENHRTILTAELGKKEGMLAFGVWVRMFCYQYETARPITSPEHLSRIADVHIHKARLLWQLLPQLLPRSLIRSPHGLLCHKTMQTLEKVDKKQRRAGATSYHDQGGDSDSDSYSSLTSSVLTSSEVKQPSESKTHVGGVGGVQTASAPPAAPATLVGLNQQAWDEYEQHRRDSRKAKLKGKSVERLQRWLVEQGDEALQAAIVEQTVRNGWTGLFELKGNPSRRNGQTAAVDADFQRWLNGEDGNTYEGEYEKH